MTALRPFPCCIVNKRHESGVSHKSFRKMGHICLNLNCCTQEMCTTGSCHTVSSYIRLTCLLYTPVLMVKGVLLDHIYCSCVSAVPAARCTHFMKALLCPKHKIQILDVVTLRKKEKGKEKAIEIRNLSNPGSQ